MTTRFTDGRHYYENKDMMVFRIFFDRLTNVQKRSPDGRRPFAGSVGGRYAVGGLALAGWLLAMVILHELLLELPDIDKLENYTPPLVTRIYDVRGEIVTELYTERRTIIPLSKIPVSLQNAFLATEDNRFFSHWGINPRAIIRAALTNLRHGRVVEGGSTITQQLSKVLF